MLLHLAGLARPSQVFSAISIAAQVCKQVDVYGYDSIFSGPAKSGNNLNYYSRNPAGFSVHDISSTVKSTAEAETTSLENAVVELLQLVGHLQIHH